MEVLITILVFFCIYALPNIINDYKASNRIPPNGYKTDYTAVNRDLANGTSKNDIFTNMNNGKYDVKK